MGEAKASRRIIWAWLAWCTSMDTFSRKCWNRMAKYIQDMCFVWSEADRDVPGSKHRHTVKGDGQKTFKRVSVYRWHMLLVYYRVVITAVSLGWDLFSCFSTFLLFPASLRLCFSCFLLLTFFCFWLFFVCPCFFVFFVSLFYSASLLLCFSPSLLSLFFRFSGRSKT